MFYVKTAKDSASSPIYLLQVSGDQQVSGKLVSLEPSSCSERLTLSPSHSPLAIPQQRPGNDLRFKNKIQMHS